MTRESGRDPIPYPIRVPLLVLAALALAAALAPGVAAARATRTVAKEADNSTLGKTVLTTVGGRTLYSLSAEHGGRFVCTTPGCLAAWRPLLIARGVKPRGPVKLGAIVRPDGRRQVTYRGRPLYRFSGDVRKGEVNGEGIRDVGTWHAAVTGPLAPQPEPEAQPPSEPAQPSPSPPPYPYRHR